MQITKYKHFKSNLDDGFVDFDAGVDITLKMNPKQ